MTTIRTKAYKALTALVATEAAGIGTAMLDGSLTWPETIVATGAALVTAAAVWRVPNPPKDGAHAGGGMGDFV